MVIKLMSLIKGLFGLIKFGNKGLEKLFMKFQADNKPCLHPVTSDIFCWYKISIQLFILKPVE
jgi:hypothetical protein